MTHDSPITHYPRSQIALRQMVSDGQVDADVARADRRRDWPLRIDAGILRAEVRFKVRTLESVRCELIRRGMPADRADEWLRGACLETPANPPGELGDALIDALKPWVATQSKSFTMADALHHLGVEGPRETRDMHTRVGIALRKLGCIRPAQGLYIPSGVAPAANSTPREWLLNLPQWDGTPRVDNWLSRYVGVKRRTPEDGKALTNPDQAYNTYVERVSRFFVLGMVARAMRPGCKFDYCLVLEGSQGKGKSTVLSILGGEWYGDFDFDVGDKNTLSALRGKWLHQFSAMGPVTRAEASQQKSFLSRNVDNYRPAYERYETAIPRQLVFAGSVDQWSWNCEATAARRFWVVSCEGAIDTQGLREAREQLFAEALLMYRQGLRYWPTPEEQRMVFDPQQLVRRQINQAKPSRATHRRRSLSVLRSALLKALSILGATRRYAKGGPV